MKKKTRSSQHSHECKNDVATCHRHRKTWEQRTVAVLVEFLDSILLKL